MKSIGGAILLLCVVLSFFACAGQKKSHAHAESSKYAQLVTAASQRTLPGRSEGEIITNYEFTILWKSDQYPTTFFWKNDGSWMNCRVSKVNRPNITEIAPELVKKEDTLQVIPVPRGKHSIPTDIPQNIARGIFFKTATGGWMYLEVNNFSRKPDIIMP